MQKKHGFRLHFSIGVLQYSVLRVKDAEKKMFKHEIVDNKIKVVCSECGSVDFFSLKEFQEYLVEVSEDGYDISVQEDLKIAESIAVENMMLQENHEADGQCGEMESQFFKESYIDNAHKP